MGWKEEEEEGGRISDRARLNVGPAKKKPVRNKSLSVGFDEKGLRDFITGFHKRKKKRRREAQQQLEEKARKLRIEQRKKRKLEIQFVYGGSVNPDAVPGPSSDIEEDDECFQAPTISGTTVYDNGDTTITVRTSELCKGEGKDVPIWGPQAEKHTIPVKERALKTAKTRAQSAKDSRKQKVLQQGGMRKPEKSARRHGSKKKREKKKGSRKQIGKLESTANDSRKRKAKKKGMHRYAPALL